LLGGLRTAGGFAHFNSAASRGAAAAPFASEVLDGVSGHLFFLGTLPSIPRALQPNSPRPRRSNPARQPQQQQQQQQQRQQQQQQQQQQQG
ncbi:hypothetical protein ETH_00036695, partial [Eimeria tenella]